MLPLAPARPDTGPVTVVVPARNEAAVIDDCLRALRAQTHAPADLRIVLVDDDSADATGDIARRHAAADPRVTVVHTAGPPPGWKGKVHALHAGVTAVPPDGGWLLFVDADTVLAPSALGRLVATAGTAGADLVSTPGGPPPGRSATWALLMAPGLQMIGENAAPDGRGRRAFAIGHCLLVRRRCYDRVGGWEALHGRRNEDVALATRVRDLGGRTFLVDGLDHVVTSGMDPFGAGWASFRKSFVAGTGGSLPVLLGGGLGQIVLSLAAPVAVTAFRRRPALAVLGALGWAAQAVAHWHTARYMRACPRLAPLAPFSGALFGAVLIDGAVRVVRGTSAWKGRADPRR